MAIYRHIHTNFWKDIDMQEFTPEEKYFYLYLMTNDLTSASGIYQIKIRNIAFDTGYNEETIKKLIDKFIEYDKILYSYENSEIMILNWFKHNNSNSPTFKKAIITSLESAKTEEFIDRYITICNAKKTYLDTVSIQYIYSMCSKSKSKSKSKRKHMCDSQTKKTQDVYGEIPAENLDEQSRGADLDQSQGENCKDTEYTEEFEKFWKSYPRKKEKKKTYRAWKTRIKQGHKTGDMIKASHNYATCCKTQKLEDRYIKHGSTFIGPDEPYKDYINYTPPPPTPSSKGKEYIHIDTNNYDYDELEERLLKNSLGSDVNVPPG